MAVKDRYIYIVWLVAFTFTIVTPIVAKIFEEPAPAVFILILGSFLVFALLLDYKNIRILKGLALIIYGAAFHLIYLNLFIFKMFPREAMPDEYAIHLDMFSQVLLVACSGAGGSVIAIYADKFSTDNEPSIIKSKKIEVNQDLKPLIKSVENLHKKINTLVTVLIVSGLLIVILLGLILTQ